LKRKPHAKEHKESGFSERVIRANFLDDPHPRSRKPERIEHNLDVIRCADWIIDLGPDGGDKGGEIVVVGTPETVAEHPTSHTGRYLKQVLKQHPPEVLAG
jgi:excinuclease ABC subunit A